MSSIKEVMSAKHHHCDELFTQAEELISNGDFVNGQLKFNEFYRELDTHFTREETVLFPAFDEAAGVESCGPTNIMRSEHEQFRLLVAQMSDNVEDQDSEQYLGNSETLLMLMQQHNTKEENMLYQMSDQMIGDVEDVLSRMEGIE